MTAMSAPTPGGTPSKAPSAGPQGGSPAAREVVDGIPDRAARRPPWKYALLAGLFVLWIALLLTLYLAGRH